MNFDDDSEGGLPYDPIGKYMGDSTVLDLEAIQKNFELSGLIRELARQATIGGSLHVLLQSLPPTDIARLARLFNSFGDGLDQSLRAQDLYKEDFLISRDLSMVTMSEIILARQLLRMYEGLPLPVSTKDDPDFDINFEAYALGVIFTAYAKINSSGSYKKELEFSTEKFTLDDSLYSMDISEWVVLNETRIQHDPKLQQYMALLRTHVKKQWEEVLDVRRKVIQAKDEMKEMVKQGVHPRDLGSGIGIRKVPKRIVSDAAQELMDKVESKKNDPISEVLNRMKKM